MAGAAYEYYTCISTSGPGLQGPGRVRIQEDLEGFGPVISQGELITSGTYSLPVLGLPLRRPTAHSRAKVALPPLTSIRGWSFVSVANTEVTGKNTKVSHSRLACP